MMKRLIPIFLLFAGTLSAKVGDDIYLGDKTNQQLVVNNRILANINGNLISVVDVMKKMDLHFYQQFPEYIESIEARYQYYQFQWKRTLQDLVDKELILADAAENKMPITNGDVRQEIEYLFGPNIITNLDKIGMTYDEAAEMLRGDILLKRMLYFRVNTKAMRQITPQAVRHAYEEYAKENQRPAMWTYQVVSIRNPDPSVGSDAAEKARELLEQDVALGQLNETLTTVGVNDNTHIRISDEFVRTESEVNPTDLSVIKKLVVGDFSPPIRQQSRDSSTVFRIFYLKSKEDGGAIPFQEVEKELEEKLMNKAMDAESERYLNKLRQHYGITESYLNEMISEDFQPFILQ